jgi:hypothetical protein
MIKQYATAPSLVPIVGMDIVDPQTGQLITDTWLEFGTANNPVTLKQTVAGDTDVEVDIKTAQKPDDAMKLKLFGDLANTLTQAPIIAQSLAEQKKKIDWGKFVQGWINAYKEYIPEANSFITNMTQEEIQQAQMQKQQAQGLEQAQAQNIVEGAELEKQTKRMEIEKGLQEMDMNDVQMAMGGQGGESESQV